MTHVASGYERRRPDLLTVAEVAALLRLHETTVRRRIREGSIPAIRLGPDDKHQLGVPADELDAWLYREE